MKAAPVLSAKGLTTILGRAGTRAVDDVSLEIYRNDVFGIVGESGSGKTTLARTLLGQQRETMGEVRFNGQVVSGLARRRARAARHTIQYSHQDQAAALDPWWTVGGTLHETLIVSGVRDVKERKERIAPILDSVGLDEAILKRYPHELSGGQVRRIGLARILVLRPALVILDEPTAGLDLSVQANVLRLFKDMQARFDLTYILVSHDLSVVRLMCNRVAVMYQGRIVESAPAPELFARPLHPYTRGMLKSAPRLDPPENLAIPALLGDPPSMGDTVTGCRFRTRCPHAIDACARQNPQLESSGPGRGVACLRWRELDPDGHENIKEKQA